MYLGDNLYLLLGIYSLNETLIDAPNAKEIIGRAVVLKQEKISAELRHAQNGNRIASLKECRARLDHALASLDRPEQRKEQYDAAAKEINGAISIAIHNQILTRKHIWKAGRPMPSFITMDELNGLREDVRRRTDYDPSPRSIVQQLRPYGIDVVFPRPLMSEPDFANFVVLGSLLASCGTHDLYALLGLNANDAQSMGTAELRERAALRLDGASGAKAELRSFCMGTAFASAQARDGYDRYLRYRAMMDVLGDAAPAHGGTLAADSARRAIVRLCAASAVAGGERIDDVQAARHLLWWCETNNIVADPGQWRRNPDPEPVQETAESQPKPQSARAKRGPDAQSQSASERSSDAGQASHPTYAARGSHQKTQGNPHGPAREPIRRATQETAREMTRNREAPRSSFQEPWSDGRSFPGSMPNGPCPCGSGRRYKMCHGINAKMPAADQRRWRRVLSRFVPQLVRDVDYRVDQRRGDVEILAGGITKMEDWLGVDNLRPDDKPDDRFLVVTLANALKAKELFVKDRDYAVIQGGLRILDNDKAHMLDRLLYQALLTKERLED